MVCMAVLVFIDGLRGGVTFLLRAGVGSLEVSSEYSWCLRLLYEVLLERLSAYLSLWLLRAGGDLPRETSVEES